MRVVICDQHVAFAESIGHVLTAQGAQVVAIVQQPLEVGRVLARQPADLCVLAIGSDGELRGAVRATLESVTQRVRTIILAHAISPELRAESVALGARGLGEMRQSMPDLLRLFHRVNRGETVLDTPCRNPRPARPITDGDNLDDSRRLASFLSSRERAVLSALVRGEDTTSIARALGISRTTARGHVQGVLTKLGTHSRLAAVTLAVRAGLVNARTGEWLIS
jgi:two-component system nitrate/nitrite response regulator NarL